MAVEVTKVFIGKRDIMGPQDGDTFSITNGTVSTTLSDGFYKVRATSDCTVRIGEDLADATGGETFKTDEVEVRDISDGFVIACDA